MEIRPIHTETDYDAALAEIAPYFEREPRAGTKAADRFDILSALIGAYEDKQGKRAVGTVCGLLDAGARRDYTAGEVGWRVAQLRYSARRRDREYLRGKCPLLLQSARQWGHRAHLRILTRWCGADFVCLSAEVRALYGFKIGVDHASRVGAAWDSYGSRTLVNGFLLLRKRSLFYFRHFAAAVRPPVECVTHRFGSHALQQVF